MEHITWTDSGRTLECTTKIIVMSTEIITFLLRTSKHWQNYIYVSFRNISETWICFSWYENNFFSRQWIVLILSELLGSRTLSTISYSHKIRMSTWWETSGPRFLLLSPDFKFFSNFKNIGNASTSKVNSHFFKNTCRKFSPNLRTIFKTDVNELMSLFFVWNDALYSVVMFRPLNVLPSALSLLFPVRTS